MYRILVTGSRTWEDAQALEAALLDVWHDTTQLGGQMLVVHGECYPRKRSTGKRPNISADWLAHLCCFAYRIPEEPHPADWNTCTPMCPDKPHRKTRADGTPYCPLAGHARNQQMVDAGADICLAFVRDGSRGTRDCTRRAHAAGIEIVEVTA